MQMPDRLLAHLRRWRRIGASVRSVIEFRGERVQKVRTSFDNIVKEAGLGNVTPHTLRHTAITWALAGQPKRGRWRPATPGASIWDVSTYFGVSPKVIEQVYGHAIPDRDAAVAAALTGAVIRRK